MFKVSKEIYLDSFTKCYKNIITISSIPEGDIKKYIKTIPRKTLSPFKTFDCCDEKSHCAHAFVDSETKDFFNIEQVDVVMNILNGLGFSLDFDLTKIMLKNKSSKNLLFYIIKKT
jgi:hypothetical protein|tara:strand:- start:1053 stop:1400 length:348 start_codon:yes stop_codon:yes gene_type:complete